MESLFDQWKAVRGGVFAGLFLTITSMAIGGRDRCVVAATQDQATQAAGRTTDQTKSEPAKPKSGLIVNDPRAYQGYTLLAPIMSKMVYLLDMEGRVIRTWEGEAPGN